MTSLQQLKNWFDELSELDQTERFSRLEEIAKIDAAAVETLRSLILGDQNTGPLLREGLTSMVHESMREVDRNFHSNRVVGPFKLIRELGSGGMGRVFLAHRSKAEFAQEVAIKLLPTAYLNSNLIKRFSAERDILATLKHPNIAYFIDAGTDDDGSPFVAMEFVSGQTITEFARAHQLALDARLRLLLQVCDAISYAHQRLVLHRDIKPNNVLVTAKGDVKLLDFGIAKLLDDSQVRTATSDRAYTRAYATPEQVLGASSTVACDVYLAAQLAYELLAGAPPFSDFADRPVVLERHVLEVPPSTLAQHYERNFAALGHSAVERSHFVRLRGELDAIIQKGMRKEPSLRYASVAEFARDLKAFLENEPISIGRGDRLYRLKKFVLRNRTASALTAALLGGSLAGGLALIAQNALLVEQRDRAEAALKLLNDAFVAADPAKVAQGSSSAKDILASSALKLEDLRESRPETYLNIGAGVAEVQWEIGLREDALALARKLIVLPQANRQPTDLLRAYRVALQTTVELEMWDEAERLFAATTKLGFSNDNLIVIARARMDVVNGKQVAAAIVRLKTLLASLNRQKQLREWMLAMQGLSYAQRVFKEDQAAINTQDEAIDYLAGNQGENHAYTIQAKLHKIDLLMRMKRNEQVLNEGEALIELIEHNYGPISSFSGRLHSVLANASVASQDYPRSVIHFEKSLMAYEKSFGMSNRLTFHARYNLATMRLTLDPKSTDGLQGLEQSVASAEQGGEFEYAAIYRSQFADRYHKIGKYMEAVQVLSAALNTKTFGVLDSNSKKEILRQLQDSLSASGCALHIPFSWEQACAQQRLVGQQTCANVIQQVCASLSKGH